MKGGSSVHSHQIPTQSSQETCAFQIWGAEEPSQGLSYDAKGLWKGFNFFFITETEFGELKQSMLYERFENRE